MQRTLIILSILIVLTFTMAWWMKQPEDIEGIHKGINTVTFSPSKSGISQAESSDQKTHNSALSEDVIKTKESIDADENSADRWLKIYRMGRDLAECEHMLKGFFENAEFDPVQTIIDNVQLTQNDETDMPTGLQIKLARQHLKHCQSLYKRTATSLNASNLADAITNDSPTAKFQQVKAQLAALLAQTEPVTFKAQRLADLLQLKKDWQDQFSMVLKVSEGDEGQKIAQADALRAEQATINDQMVDLRTQINGEETDPIIYQELAELNFQSRNIDVKLVQLKQINHALRTQTINEFMVLNDAMFKHLKSSDADVFFEAQTTLEPQLRVHKNFFGYMPFKNIGKNKLKAPFVEYVSPGDVIKEITGIFDNESFGLVIDYATQLYWCELGADCGPNNLWIRMYCFNDYGQFNADSCGLDLKTFYQQHLLSPNQWDDVLLIKQIMGDLYAH